jgi:hypothetical protein
MKPGTITNGFASLDLSYSGIVPPAERGRVLEITNLLTPSTNRRQNHASLLMQSVCEQADEANMLLLLMPQAFGTDGLTSMQLQFWYTSKFGFVALQQSPTILIRMPATAGERWAAANAH